jgi:EmrB/QacA subfamily drug resistance transporter
MTQTSAAGGALALHSAAGRLTLAATVAASGMAALDATIVYVALPHIGHDLHTDVSGLQWVVTGYLVTLASLILLAGALGDRFGRRRVFSIGVLWFAGGSALCGLAPSVGVLVAARAVQGIGGALLTPGSLAIIQAAFRPEDRGRAIGAWSGLGGIAAAVGPFIGGAVVDGPGWRWAFLLNLPIAAVTLLITRAAVPESRSTELTAGLDVGGAAIGVVALAAATWALTEAGPLGWGAPSVVAAAVVAVAAGVVFVRHMRRAATPLVPPSLFANRTFTVVNLETTLLYAALGVSFFLVVYELQVAAHWSALRAGSALIPATVLMLVASSRSGDLAVRIGPRVQLTAGPILTAAGLLLLARVGPHAEWATDVLPAALVFGVGLVTFVAPLTATVMGAADPDHVSTASGVNNAIARTAGLAAVAVVPVVSGLTTAHGPDAVTHAFRVALVIAAALAAAAAPLAFAGLRRRERCPQAERRVHCAVDGTPLQPNQAEARDPVPAG